MIHPECAGCHAGGWCEYDFETDTVYPYHAGDCPLAEGKHMTVNEYQQQAMRTAEKNGRTWSNVGLGLAGEAGEVADAIKKYLHQGHPLDREKVAKELGDVAWYVALGATVLGVELEEILKANIQKLLGRYPEGFDPQRSINREDER